MTTTTDVSDRVAATNSSHYGSREDPTAHFKSRYHLVRLQLAVELLVEGLARSASQPSHGAPTVLELGAGCGSTAKVLAEHGLSVIATDVAKEQLPDPPPAGVRTRRIDASKPLPIDSGSIDAVFAGELIEHLFDTRGFLGEVRRVLRPGGVLVLTTPNLAGLQDRLGFVLGRSPRHVDPLHRYLYLHIRPFTARSLRGTLRQTGFRDVRLRSNFVTIRWRRSGRRTYLRTAARLFPALGGSLVVAATRDG